MAGSSKKASRYKDEDAHKILHSGSTPIGYLFLFLLYLVYIFLDVLWVKHRGYSGLGPVLMLYMGAFYVNISIFIGIIGITIIISLITKANHKPAIFDFFSALWLYFTILGIYILNEYFIPGRFGLSNPKSIILSIIAFCISIIILRFIGIKYAKSRIKNFFELSIKGLWKSILLLIVCYIAFMVLFRLGYSPIKPKIGTLPELPDGRKNPSVIIVTLDTLRADHVGIYGYNKPTTPNIDAFANESIIFDNAYTPIPLTTPAHVSIFTGNLPQNHIVLENTSVFNSTPVTKPDGTKYENKAVGTILRENGYHTFAAVSAIHLGNKFGWGHFVDSLNEYDPPFSGKHWYMRDAFQITPLRLLAVVLHKYPNPIRKSDGVTNCFEEWLNKNIAYEKGFIPAEPFFAWLHYFDVHLPYDPPEKYWRKYDPDYEGKLTGSTHDVEMYNQHKDELVEQGVDLDRYIEHVKGCYDGETLFMDEQFGKFIKILKDAEIYDDTLIIVCADHGEGLGERGFFGHNSVPFDYEMRIPFIVKPPNYRGGMKRIEEPVTLCDIMPTICDITGIDAGVRMDGTSFVNLINGTSVRNNKYDWPVPGMVFLVAHSLRWPDRQVVRFLDRERQSVVWSYFDLINDPGAFDDLYASGGLLPEDDKLDLINWIEKTGADFQYLSQQAQEKKDLDEWTVEQLRAVGYLQ